VLTVCADNQRKIEVVYQDRFLAVLNKPAGVVVLKGPTVKGLTLEDWLRENFRSSAFNCYHYRAGIVHRLDKETWGLILVAKTDSVFTALQHQFKERKVKKIYWALVRGEPPAEGQIVAPIGRLPGRRLKWGVVPRGRKAITDYRLKRRLLINHQWYSLVEVRPITGRTHQIRVHFQYLGHPVFGDPLYGGRRERGRPMFLVAKTLEFFHPEKKERLTLTIDLPQELSSWLNEND